MSDPHGSTARSLPSRAGAHARPVVGVDGARTSLRRRPEFAPWRSSEVLAACRLALGRICRDDIPSLGFTSTRRGEGRTSIASACALVSSQDYQRRTILVELDLEHPVMAARFGINDRPGLGELVRNESSLGDCVQFVDDRLGVVVAGAAGGPLAALAAKVVGSNVLPSLRNQSDAVIADLPPLLGCEFGSRLAQACGALALVLQSSITRLPEVRRAMKKLRQPAPVILNDIAAPSTPAWVSSFIGT